jgi:hypothetical protein
MQFDAQSIGNDVCNNNNILDMSSNDSYGFSQVQFDAMKLGFLHEAIGSQHSDKFCRNHVKLFHQA